MLGHEYGQISYFQNGGLQKNVHGCLETKIGKELTFKTFISLDALPSPPPQNKIAFTYVENCFMIKLC